MRHNQRADSKEILENKYLSKKEEQEIKKARSDWIDYCTIACWFGIIVCVGYLFLT